MTMISSNRLIVLAIAALLAAPSVALAQSAQAPGRASPSAPGPGAGKAAPVGAAAGVEQSIKELHAQLKITPAEEPQWEPFAQAMRDNARDIDQMLAQQSSSMTAVQDMEWHEKIAEADVKHLQKLIPAFQSLYASLSPEQKKRADDIFRGEGREHTGSGGRPR
jgi:LTXXQ motif family protein